MIDFFVMQIKMGRKTIEDVPLSLRDEVKEILKIDTQERGLGYEN